MSDKVTMNRSTVINLGETPVTINESVVSCAPVSTVTVAQEPKKQKEAGNVTKSSKKRTGVCKAVIDAIKAAPISKQDLIKHIREKFPESNADHIVNSVIWIHNRKSSENDKIVRDDNKRFTIKSAINQNLN